MLPGNAEAIEAWNTVLFDKFSRYRDVLIAGLGRHGERALELYPPRTGQRVVDIGCGFGDTTIAIGKLVGPDGIAVGVDAAERFIACGREDAAGMRNVRFEVADIEERVPGGPYDLAFSRMGTMFFASPVFALRNIRKVLVPDGMLCMVVWRKKDANPCFHAAELAVHALLGEPPKGDQVTCGPGPFSMASPDLVGDQLVAAGYRNPCFERFDAPIKIGRDLDDAVGFALTLGPAGEIVRLAGEVAVQRRAEIEAAVREVLAPWLEADGVWAPSSTWIVSATA
ncbi:MAG: class I SAM-dependent methyltransferase [Kofleriaceae bacterium]